MNNRMANFRRMSDRRRVSYFGNPEDGRKDDALEAANAEAEVETEGTIKCPDRKNGCNLYNTFECNFEETGICPKRPSEK